MQKDAVKLVRLLQFVQNRSMFANMDYGFQIYKIIV